MLFDVSDIEFPPIVFFSLTGRSYVYFNTIGVFFQLIGKPFSNHATIAWFFLISKTTDARLLFGNRQRPFFLCFLFIFSPRKSAVYRFFPLPFRPFYRFAFASRRRRSSSAFSESATYAVSQSLRFSTVFSIGQTSVLSRLKIRSVRTSYVTDTPCDCRKSLPATESVFACTAAIPAFTNSVAAAKKGTRMRIRTYRRILRRIGGKAHTDGSIFFRNCPV